MECGGGYESRTLIKVGTHCETIMNPRGANHFEEHDVDGDKFLNQSELEEAILSFWGPQEEVNMTSMTT